MRRIEAPDSARVRGNRPPRGFAGLQRRPGELPRRVRRYGACVPYRVALYSHDTMGLGHMRRNLLLAQALRHSRLQAVVLMIAGAREASLLTSTAGVDCVALPSLWKDGGGQYHPRHLAVSLEELLALRARTAGAALEAFAPDVLIVDNVPRGALRELDPVLESLRTRGRTRLVLGLRGVLHEPATRSEERRVGKECRSRWSPYH